jgi:hypothetical protein
MSVVLTRRLLALAAGLEAVTGLALITAPMVVAHWLLGAELKGAGVAMGRVAGCALVALAVACSPGRDRASCCGSALWAMLTYNLLVTCYLVLLGTGGQFVGVLLWPAVAIHGIFSLLFARASWPLATAGTKPLQ